MRESRLNWLWPLATNSLREHAGPATVPQASYQLLHGHPAKAHLDLGDNVAAVGDERRMFETLERAASGAATTVAAGRPRRGASKHCV